MGSSNSLTSLQQQVLKRFFQHEQGFFLTGGAALVGYYLHHRSTSDLDLFTVTADAFERGPFVVQRVAEELSATIEVRQDAPGFKRFVLTTREDGVVIDLVHEKVTQLIAEKRSVDGVLVDPQEEIFANKLTALVGRMEERDLVDVYCLERAGLQAEDYLTAAVAKDGGATPATLAWLLSELSIPDEASLPGGIAAAELRAFLAALVVRLRKVAFPESSS